MTTIERLEAVLTYTKNTYNSFAKSIGLKRSQNLYDIRDGKVKNISFELASTIINKYPEFRMSWLTKGEGDMILNVLDFERKEPNPRLEVKPTRLYADPLDYDNNKEKFIYLPDGTIAMRVPIVPSRAYAGYMVGFADPEYYDDLDDILIGVDREANGTYLGFEVVGSSMVNLSTVELAEQSIFPGRIAIGRELESANWKSRLHTHNYLNWIFVHRTEGILIKQITNHDVDKGIITIHSLNPDYPDEDLLLEDMQQIFSVIQIVQRTRPKLK